MINTFESLNLESADDIANKVIEVCKINNFKEISVCIVDPMSNIIVQKKMDKCPCGIYPKFAFSKAFTSSAMMMPSNNFAKKYASEDPEQMFKGLAMMSVGDGKIGPLPGGVLIKKKGSNEILGSVGVSGASGAEDEYCAIMGIKNSKVCDAVICYPDTHSCNTYIN